MVIRACSFKLNGPGFNVKDQGVKGTLYIVVGSVAAISFPSGRETICAAIEEIDRGFVLNPKNWFTNERIMQHPKPIVHVLNVNAGCVGSSVIGTVSLTCSIGESSTSLSSSSTSKNL
jgi:energy-converting hydrogenase Eha subunit E